MKVEAIKYNKWTDKVEFNFYGFRSTPWNNLNVTRSEWELQGCE